MKRWKGFVFLWVMAGALALVGCDIATGFLLPSTTTVSLVNEADFDVQVTLYLDDQQDIPEFLLTQAGTKVERTVAPGETQTFTRDCDNLQAIIVDDADLRIVGGIGPETNTDVFRDGSDFGCGDTIIFTFSSSSTLTTDFRVTTDIVPFTLPTLP